MCVALHRNNASRARNRTDTAGPFCAVAFCCLHAMCLRPFKWTMPFY